MRLMRLMRLVLMPDLALSLNGLQCHARGREIPGASSYTLKNPGTGFVDLALKGMGQRAHARPVNVGLNEIASLMTRTGRIISKDGATIKCGLAKFGHLWRESTHADYQAIA